MVPESDYADARADAAKWRAEGEKLTALNLSTWNEAQRLRVAYLRLREWVDTEGRNCPSNAAVDAALASRENEVTDG